jgi:pilus assembly protein FimV
MRLRLFNAAATLLLAVPGICFGLGLGEIQLRSSLNAPLNAEIELFATDEELGTLQAQLASRDTFARYGLDYPAFLTGVQVHVLSLADGRKALQLTTATPITEPFATFLVEANWARGRIQREYTVLFDPPTFAPQTAAAPPVAAPTAGGTPGSEISRPAQPQAAQAPAAAARPRPAPTGSGGGGEYKVPRGDSLSSIAVSHYGESESQQAMIAIYRANPQAFGGNINQLLAGAVLRLPSNSDVAALDRGDAVGEVRRQMAEWASRAAPAGGSQSSPRLVLVPPGGGAGAGAAPGSSTSQPSAAAPPQPGTAAGGNRLQVGDAGLASVQQNATRQAEPTAAPATTPGATPAPGEEVSAEEVTPPAAVQAEPAGAPSAGTAEQPTPKPPKKPAAKPAATPAPEPSLLDRVQEYWYVPVGLLVLLALALGVRAARRRREASGDGFAPFAIEPAMPEERDTSADTFPLRKPTDSRDPSIVVEENATPRAAANRKEPTRTVDLDESHSATPGVDATGTFEQGDPLAEADFHMAYGLYDQAADLVKLAIAREPSRRDLKLKLLEVYFVWGNKEQFLQMARELSETRDAAQPGEWEKVVIMGKQLAPEDPLFTQSYGSVGPSSVDLNLEGGQNLVDFDLPGESSTRLPQLGKGEAGNSQGVGLDFTLDDTGRNTALDDGATTLSTQQLPTQELPRQNFAIDGPTVEQPALGLDDTLAGKLGAPRAPLGGTDQTAELALDDLGLDLGKLEATGSNLLDDSQLTRALDAGDPGSENSETLVAGLEDTARHQLQQAGNSEATELMPMSEAGTGDTSRVAALDLNLDSDGNATTGKRGTPDFNLDLDVGSAEQSPDGEYQRTQRIEPGGFNDADATQRDLEPVSMSEVGTKLDLARAYMDMGDPDGARNILGEVLAEGSPAQRQEAQRLLDSIPG